MSRTFRVLVSRTNAAEPAGALGVTGSAIKPSLSLLKMFDPTERSSVPSSAVLILDPCSSLPLVHRLASLLWRLRRASAIETGLFEMHAELRLARRQDRSRGPGQPGTLQTPAQANGHKVAPGSNGRDDSLASDQEPPSTSMPPPLAPWWKRHTIAQCFLRLSNLDPTLLDRVGSYETRLWRQAAQTIWTLEAMRQPQPPIRQRLRHRVAPFTWDRER
jgi:hypothetical protein